MSDVYKVVMTINFSGMVWRGFLVMKRIYLYWDVPITVKRL